MSRNGSICLQRIVVNYGILSDKSGIRQALARELPAFKRQYPSVGITLQPRVWPSNSMIGVYNDGSHLTLSITALSAQAILTKAHELVQTANDEVKYFKAQTLHTDRKSVQGGWNPWLWMMDAPVSRQQVPRWDRKLSEKEWDYYVRKYTASWKDEEQAIRNGVRRSSDLHNEYSEELTQRWKAHVEPQLPTDVETTVQEMKAQAAVGKRPQAPTYDEYMLFSMPDMRRQGKDAIMMLRRKQATELVQWWGKRKEQLKEPN
eukprot:PhF_6_TR29308/c0_g1_i3/m.42980/K17424/MRPL43; large subunit ribosomal protein L43